MPEKRGKSVRTSSPDDTALLRAVLSDQSELIARWTPDQVTTWVNDRFCEVTGLERDEIVGTRKPWFRADQIWNDSTMDATRLTPDKPAQRGEYEVELPSGDTAWLEWDDRGIFDDDGALVEIQSVGRDITERRRLEMLRRNEAVLNVMLSQINDAVLTIEGDTVVDCNPAALRIMGEDRERIVGSTAWALSPEFQPDGRRSEEKGREFLSKARAGQPVRFEWVHQPEPDGAISWVDVSLSCPAHDGDSSILAILRDTTEIRSANQMLARQVEFQRQKADIMNELTAMTRGDMDECCGGVLRRIGELYGATRIFVWERDDRGDESGYSRRFGWATTGAPEGASEEKSLTARQMDWIDRELQAGRFVYVPDIESASDHAKDLCKILSAIDSRALLAVPIVADGVLFGASTFTTDRADPWDELAIDELQTLSNILATCVTRIRSAAALEQHAALQARLAAVSSRLLNAGGDEIREALAETLEKIGIDYGFDRVNVNWFETQHPSYGSPIDWAPREHPIQVVMPSELPWSAPQVVAGQIVRVDDVELLPKEAEIDRALYAKLGYRSVLGIPLTYGPRMVGAMTIATVEQRIWTDDTIKELALFADLISNATIRQWSIAELTQRERDLARSQSVASVGSFSVTAVLDDDGVAEYRNLVLSDEARRIYSVSDEEVDAHAMQAYIHPDDRPRVAEMWNSITTGTTSGEVQYRILRADGTARYVQATAHIDEIDEQRFAKAFGTVKDVTDWVEANQKLESALADVALLKDKLQEENVYLRDEVRAAHGFGAIIGNSRKLRNVLKLAEQVAPTDVTVLITGETGTGKELVARAIHDQSSRRDRAMVCVNCAAISDELIESELFGHEKGAFTGAHAQRKGRFELADGGTLFLDEIGEMSGNLQSKLLRVIQEGEFERLGGSETLKTDVRIVAATNRDLMNAVDAGDFRADLYYRINSFPVHMPPLRERKADIPLLAEHLIKKHAARLGKNIASMSERMMQYLQRQPWPGNIRELEGTIVRAIVTCNDIVLDYAGGQPAAGSGTAATQSDTDALAEVQRAHILDVLERRGWKIEGRKGAACALGMPPSSLRALMKRLDIVRPALD